MIERIAIVGTGLLGASAGLALRAAGFRGTIAGWNRSPEQAQTALDDLYARWAELEAKNNQQAASG